MVDLIGELSKLAHRDKSPIPSFQLKASLDAIDNALEPMWTKHTPVAEIQNREQELIQALIERQIAEAKRYQNIFRTANGSIYFVFSTGESLRIKKTGEGLRPQPIFDHIYYVDKDQLDELLEMRRQDTLQDEIIGKRIRIAPCSLGITPFEFGIQGYFPQSVTQEPNSITILGDKSGVFASGYHLGHPITELIK